MIGEFAHPMSALQEMINGDEGKEMIRLCIGLCQPPNCLEWAQLFVEGLICVERFINVFEICQNDNLVFTLLGTYILHSSRKILSVHLNSECYNVFFGPRKYHQ